MLHQSTRRKNPSAFPRALCILLSCSMLHSRCSPPRSTLLCNTQQNSEFFLSSAPPPSLENCLDVDYSRLAYSRSAAVLLLPLLGERDQLKLSCGLWLCVRIKTICVIGWHCWDFNALGRPHVACDLLVETSMEKKGFCKSTGHKSPSQSLK